MTTFAHVSQRKLPLWTGAFVILCFALFSARHTTPKVPKASLVALSATISPLPGSQLTAVWANDGEDKVTQDELRSTRGTKVINGAWDGKVARAFGARNEVVSVNLVLEAGLDDAKEINVSLKELTGPGNFKIASKPVSKDGLFNFVDRNIELFYVRYLQIKGLCRLSYDPTYDERHVPFRLQLPYTLPKGKSSGLFSERPDAFKFYPDIAVPIEAVNTFTIRKGNNQSIWIDVYIPKKAIPGRYQGVVEISESEKKTIELPVELEVLPFTLPDAPSAKTMVYFSESNVNNRYTGVRWDDSGAATPAKLADMQKVWNNYQLVAHRHKISLVNDGGDPLNKKNWKMQRWFPVLTGDLFTAKNGYDGPGVGVSSGIYSIGTYGSWRTKRWSPDSEADMVSNTDKWVNWFEGNFPDVEYFLYLQDEPKEKDFATVEKWASWIKNNPGPGARMKTLVTSDIMKKTGKMPSVNIGFVTWGDAAKYRPFMEKFSQEGKYYWAYNGTRPMDGSFAIEDEGVALRVNAWTQFKLKAKRWFVWESTQYKNSSRTSLETNVFEQAQTFGRKNDQLHPKFGETGPEYNNGDGILFYPGTDTVYKNDSYQIMGPIVSLRLKLWRRGLQDYEYLAMAEKKDPVAVKSMVQRMVPRTLWEVGVSEPKDPSYVHTGISWSVDPDHWEKARRELADIIGAERN